MRWDNLEILADNFQVPGRWASRRYDAVFAHGVFYHCVDPFYFFDQLTRISDTIFVGGWVASDKAPLSEWRTMRYADRSYRVQIYEEVAYVAYHLHWPLDDIIDLEHPTRRRFVEEIGRINGRLSRGG